MSDSMPVPHRLRRHPDDSDLTLVLALVDERLLGRVQRVPVAGGYGWHAYTARGERLPGFNRTRADAGVRVARAARQDATEAGRGDG
jgi:hypothetical protein